MLKITLCFPHKVSTHLHWYFPSYAYSYTCTSCLFQSTPQSTCCQAAPPDVSCGTQIMEKGGLKMRAAAGCRWEMEITNCLLHFPVTRQSWLACNQTEHSSRHFVFSGWSSASPRIPFTFFGKGLESERLGKSSSPELRGWGLLAALNTETFYIFQYLAVGPQKLVMECSSDRCHFYLQCHEWSCSLKKCFKAVSENVRNTASKVGADFLEKLSAQGNDNVNSNDWTKAKDDSKRKKKKKSR